MIKSSLIISRGFELNEDARNKAVTNIKTLENAILSKPSVINGSLAINDVFTSIFDKFSIEINGMLNDLRFNNVTTYTIGAIYFDLLVYNINNMSYEQAGKGQSRITFINISDLATEIITRFGKRIIKPITIFGVDSVAADLDYFYFLIGPKLTDYIYSRIVTKFNQIYLPLYNTIKTDYDILKPFNIILNETKNNTSSGTNNRTRNLKDSSTLTNDYDLKSDNEDNNSTDSIFAFNDTDGKPVDKNVTSSVRTSKSTSTDTEDTSRTGTDNYSTSRSDTESRNYTRAGNIGNRSNAQLIEEERKKLMFDLREYIINDIVDTLCAGTWSD